jgi:membrane carboxypeptidase/penicillin-binding protein PbpC
MAYVPTSDEITLFVSANRVDILIQGPAREKERASFFFNRGPEQKLELDGQSIEILPENPNPREPAENEELEPERDQMFLRWGSRTLTLGRVKGSTPPRYYRQLTPVNAATAPKSAAEVLKAMGFSS